MTAARLAAFKAAYPQFDADNDLCRGIYEVFCAGAASRDAEESAQRIAEQSEEIQAFCVRIDELEKAVEIKNHALHKLRVRCGIDNEDGSPNLDNVVRSSQSQVSDLLKVLQDCVAALDPFDDRILEARANAVIVDALQSLPAKQTDGSEGL